MRKLLILDPQELEKKAKKLQNDRRAKKGNGISLVPDRSKNAFVHRMYFSSYMYGGKKYVFISKKKICKKAQFHCCANLT